MKTKKIIVQKYGGSSVATVEKIKAIANHLRQLHEQGSSLVVVLSAMGKTTNNLINLANEFSPNPNKRDLDFLVSIGEMQTVSLMSIYLNELGVNSVCLTGYQAGITTNNNHSHAFIKDIDNNTILKHLNNNKIVIVAGFQGVTEDKEITTLGRGGSDTTAVALASSLKCPCEIYTDVEAVKTVDPNFYKEAKSLHQISYDEMMEMAVNGAKVLETRSVELAKKNNVDLYLGKTLELDKEKGTKVNDKLEFEDMPIKSVSCRDNYSVININLAENNIINLLDIFNKLNINYEMLTFSNNVFSFSYQTNFDEDIKNILNNLNLKFNIISNVTKLCIVGLGLSTHYNYLQQVINSLNNQNINPIQISMCEITISVLIDSKHKENAINLIAKEFNL